MKFANGGLLKTSRAVILKERAIVCPCSSSLPRKPIVKNDVCITINITSGSLQTNPNVFSEEVKEKLRKVSRIGKEHANK